MSEAGYAALHGPSGGRWDLATRLEADIETLAYWIITNAPGEPSRSEGAVQTAIRLLRDGKASREALQRIANTDLRRASAGYIQQIAIDALAKGGAE